MKLKDIDIIGKKFNNLTVKRLVKKEKGFEWYACDCDCGEGKDVLVRKDHLIHGETRSCGCLRGRDKLYNPKFLLSDNKTTVVFFNNTSDKCFLSTTDVLPILDENTFTAQYTTNKKGEIVRTDVITAKNNTVYYLSRMILGLENGDPLQADHLNRKTLDNRPSNLRILTELQNKCNRLKNGIGRIKKTPEGWQLTITDENNVTHTSYHLTEEDAEQARHDWLDNSPYFHDYTPWYSDELAKQDPMYYYLDSAEKLCDCFYAVSPNVEEKLLAILGLSERNICKIKLRELYTFFKVTHVRGEWNDEAQEKFLDDALKLIRLYDEINIKSA